MFELMDNYNAKEKLIFSTGGQITYDINTLIQESYGLKRRNFVYFES